MALLAIWSVGNVKNTSGGLILVLMVLATHYNELAVPVDVYGGLSM